MPRRGRVRLDRALSRLGLASRAEARSLIVTGRVTLDGRLVTNPALPVVPETARIAIEGAQTRPAPWRTIALNKPRGVVTTSRDPEGRRTVYDLLGATAASMVAVGRLDMASTGLLLLTTDTRLAAWLTDPANMIVRRYVVTARGRVTDDAVQRMVDGIGALKAHRVEILKRSTRETHLIVELTEGRNREIRRLLADVGHEVTRLLRVAFGRLELGSLQPGTWRDVSLDEMAGAFPSWTAHAVAFDMARPPAAGRAPGRGSQRPSRSSAITRHSSSSGPVSARRPARRYQ